MRELITCNEHGYRWSPGDTPCPVCKKENDRRNKQVEELSIPRTRKGKTWPLSASEKPPTT